MLQSVFVEGLEGSPLDGEAGDPVALSEAVSRESLAQREYLRWIDRLKGGQVWKVVEKIRHDFFEKISLFHVHHHQLISLGE